MITSISNMSFNSIESIDDKELDEQHSKLIEFTNNLILNYDREENIEVISAIDSLVNYAIYHFKFEEEMLKQKGYPDLEKHKVLHDIFRNKVDSLRKKIEGGDKDVIDQMILFLRSWIKHHISIEDVDYKKYL